MVFPCFLINYNRIAKSKTSDCFFVEILLLSYFRRVVRFSFDANLFEDHFVLCNCPSFVSEDVVYSAKFIIEVWRVYWAIEEFDVFGDLLSLDEFNDLNRDYHWDWNEIRKEYHPASKSHKEIIAKIIVFFPTDIKAKIIFEFVLFLRNPKGVV